MDFSFSELEPLCIGRAGLLAWAGYIACAALEAISILGCVCVTRWGAGANLLALPGGGAVQSPGCQGRVYVPEERSQDGDTLDNDGAHHFRGIPDVGVRVVPKVILILDVFRLLPAYADCGHDGNYHALRHELGMGFQTGRRCSSMATHKAHGYTETNLLYPAQVEFPGNDPWECGEDKVHDDVVN